MAHFDQEPFRPEPILKAAIRDMADQLSPRLYVVVAPAGYGKTTVSRLLAARHERRAYCDLYGVDSMGHVAEILLRGLAEEDGARSLSLGRDVLGSGRDIGRLREITIEAWRDAVQGDSLFVIDHLEWIDDKPEIRALLNDVLAWRHPIRRVALCSRNPIALRTSRYAAPHETLYVTSEMLRFDQSDIVALAGQTAISRDDLDIIDRKTLGWPVAVLLLLRSAIAGRIVPAVRRFLASDQANLDDFLQGEVVDRLSEDQLTALMVATFTEGASLEDVACALKASMSQRVRTLLRAIPIVVTDEADYLTVHPLLQEIIERRYSSKKRSLMLAVAHRHQDNGDLLRAAQVFLSADAADAAATALETLSAEYSLAGAYLFDAPSLETALLIGRIDAATTVRHPMLWASSILAWIYTRPSADWLDEARIVWKSIAPDAPSMIRASVLGSYANVAGILGRFEEIDTVFREFESALHPEDSLGQTVLLMWRTVMSVWHGLPTDVDATTRQIGEALAVPATSALWSFHVCARNLRELGKKDAEAAALTNATSAGAISQLPLIHSLILAERVFHAWFWGDDENFEVWTLQLENTMLSSFLGGFRHLLACCRGRGHVEPPGFETLAFRCMAYLIGCSRSSTAESRLECARSAVGAADESNSWFYKAIARVACALLEQSEIKSDLLREARLCARKTESPALISAVDAVAEGYAHSGMLAEFVKRFNTRQPKTDVAVSILRMNVTSGGTDTALAPREMELLVALAVAGRMVDREELSQKMWPDKSADAARSNLRLNLLRLRNRLASSSIVATERECGITSGVTVDITDLAAVLRRVSHSDDIGSTDRAMLERTLEVDLNAIAASTRTWEWFAPTFARVEDLVREAGLLLAREAMRRESWREALAYAKGLLQRDPSDETACELTMVAAKKADDAFGASLALRQHARSLSEEFGATPSSHLRRLLDDVS